MFWRSEITAHTYLNIFSNSKWFKKAKLVEWYKYLKVQLNMRPCHILIFLKLNYSTKFGILPLIYHIENKNIYTQFQEFNPYQNYIPRIIWNFKFPSFIHFNIRHCFREALCYRGSCPTRRTLLWIDFSNTHRNFTID